MIRKIYETYTPNKSTSFFLIILLHFSKTYFFNVNTLSLIYLRNRCQAEPVNDQMNLPCNCSDGKAFVLIKPATTEKKLIKIFALRLLVISFS